MTKSLLSFILFMVFCTEGKSQVYKNILPASQFSELLSKVVLDFRNDFKNIQGDPEPKEVGMDLYASYIKLPGSDDNHIVRSHSVKDANASFQATMYKGEDYDKAVKIYKNCFTLIKRTRVRWVDNTLSNFVGKIQQPEGLNFTVSYLKVEIQDDRYRDFVTEVELVNSNFSTWEVHINITKKKLDVEVAPDN